MVKKETGFNTERNTDSGFQDRLLGAFYSHRAGRTLLSFLIRPAFSEFGGFLLSTRLSALFVRPFIQIHHLECQDWEKQKFSSFNDFFTRKYKKDSRPFSDNPKDLISPCDARLSVFPIQNNSHFRIKGTEYTLKQLLRDSKLAAHFEGGDLWLFRLCVDDYHRYIYPETAVRSSGRVVHGVLHTVNPVANDYYPIYKENSREYCAFRLPSGERLLMMEVGAMLVGKIENHISGKCDVKRGQEKGNFAFGGSTIVLITERNAAAPRVDILRHSFDHFETKVRMGETVGYRSELS